MRKILAFLVLLSATPALAQYLAYNGQCAQGGQAVITQGLVSSGTKPLSGGVVAPGTGVVGSYPFCLVTVYLTGTVTQAQIYSSASGGVITQPFTANADGSFLFFALPAIGYDITISGAGLAFPGTLTDVVLGGGGGGGGSGTVTQITATLPVVVTPNPITTVGDIELFVCPLNQTYVSNGTSMPCGALPGGTVTGTGTIGYLPEWGTTTGLINSPLLDTGGSISLNNPSGGFGGFSVPKGSVSAIYNANDTTLLCSLPFCYSGFFDTLYSGTGFSGTLEGITATAVNTSGTTAGVVAGQFFASIAGGAVTSSAGISVTALASSNSGSLGNQYGIQVLSVDRGNSTFLLTSNKGIDITTGTQGGVGTGGLTNDYGLYIEPLGATGSQNITNHAGIYIADQGAQNFANSTWYALYIAPQTIGPGFTKPTPFIGLGNVNLYSGSGAPTFNCGSGTTPSIYWRTDAASVATQQYGCISGTTWTAFTTGAGSGTVTSVAQTINGTSPSGIFTVTGSPVTTAGTLNINLAGTSGGIPYFSSSTVLSSSAALASGQFVLGGGAGAAPTTSFSIIPTANGGTGINSSASTGVPQVASGTWSIAVLPLTALATQAANTVVMNATGGTALPTAVVMPTCTGSSNADIYDTTLHAWACNSASGISGLTTGVIPQAGSATTIVNTSPQFDNNLTNANELTYAGTGLIIAPTTPANGQIGLTGTGGTTETMTVNISGTLISFSNGMLASNVTDSALTNGNCVQAGAGGILTSSSGSCAGSPTWNSIIAPTGNEAINMYQVVGTSFTTTFTYGNATGAATNLFNITDTASNTGTGALFNVATAASSAAAPVQFTALGASNGVQMDTTGLLKAIGSGGINATKVNSNTYPAAAALNSGAVLCTTGASTVTSSSTLTLNNMVVGGGTGACPGVLASASFSSPTFSFSPNQVSGTGAALAVTPTWNNAGSVFDAAFVINPTNTNSAAGSLLADFQLGGVTQYKIDKAGNSTQFGVATFSPALRAFAGLGSASYLVVNAPADTGITAATESIGINHVGATRTWSDGTVTTQREYLFQPPTYAKTTSAATFTKAATLAISGAPVASSGVTITNDYALWVQAGLAQFDGGLTVGAGPSPSAGTSGGMMFTCGTAPTGIASNAAMYCDSASQTHLLSGVTDLGIIATQSQTAIQTSDWTCGTGGTVSSCVAAQTIGTLTFTLPLEVKNWHFECDLIVGQATGATANNWDIQTATNGATNTASSWMMNTAATAIASGALTGSASSTSSVDVGVTWTLGGTATKMPVHWTGTIEGVSASGTVLNFQLKAPTVGDLVTIYRGSSCRIY